MGRSAPVGAVRRAGVGIHGRRRPAPVAECWDRKDAFALLAAHRIASIRSTTSGDVDRPADRQAYVLRSLKRPEEVRLLRQLYASRFVLISCYSPGANRQAYLEKRIRESRVKPHRKKAEHSAADLIRRDQKEELDHGQDVLGTFPLGDFFVDARPGGGGADSRVPSALDSNSRCAGSSRFSSRIRGARRRATSSTDQAAAAMRRSAELGRQVGAAICTHHGDVVAVGVNEVPKPGGGLYWEGDAPDKREFQLGRDTSDERKLQIAKQIVEGLLKAELLGEGVNEKAVLEEVAKTDLDSLIEFIRAVHAEMAAIIDAARRGISVDGCTIFVTTFPCHHCARHIVAAGIRRVVYIAPYAKSMAEELHSDSLVVTGNVMLEDKPPDPKKDPRVRFEPFVGVGPRRYMEMFEAPERKLTSGKLVEWTAGNAQPRLADLEPDELRFEVLPYLLRERAAEDVLHDIVEEREPKLSVDPPPPTARDVPPKSPRRTSRTATKPKRSGG